MLDHIFESVVEIELTEFAGNLLLFCLVFGMSATVDTEAMVSQLKNRKAIFTGVVLQFVVLPYLGYAVVNTLGMSAPMGITLLVVTSSPGGSYSNWWCSLFNADLALSVTMTAISTVMSIVMLPLNLLLYAQMSYDADVTSKLDWEALFISLLIVLSGIALGMYCSYNYDSPNFKVNANRLGNIAGISLVLFSCLLSGSDEESGLWSRPRQFYLGVAAPCVLGLVTSAIVSTCFQLRKPERVTVGVECCYQNTGIATSVALTMFSGDDLAEAMGVPLYYGLVEAVVLGLYCAVAWKAGWTKAPPSDSFCYTLSHNYEAPPEYEVIV